MNGVGSSRSRGKKGRGGEDTFETAPFEALYHTRPGRGREAPVEEMFIIDPPCPWAIILGTNAWTARKMPLTLTSKTRWNSSSVTSDVGCESILAWTGSHASVYMTSEAAHGRVVGKVHR